MVETLLGKTMRAARTVTVAVVAMSVVLFLVWCTAVICHLCLLRFPVIASLLRELEGTLSRR